MTSSSPSSSPSPPQTSMLLYWHESQYDDRNFQVHSRTLFFSVALLSIVFFIALLTLFIQKSCGLSQNPAINLHAPSPEHSEGLDMAAIRSLPVVLFRKEEAEKEEEEECCICLGGFEEGDKMKMLPPCSHCYHCECVDRWLKTESNCPLCRVSVRVDSSSMSFGKIMRQLE